MKTAVTTSQDGTVSVQIGGELFRFRATIDRVAEFSEALGGDCGLQNILDLFDAGDQRAIWLALKHWCISGNEALLDELPAGRMLSIGRQIIEAALFGLPEAPAAAPPMSPPRSERRVRAIRGAA